MTSDLTSLKCNGSGHFGRNICVFRTFLSLLHIKKYLWQYNCGLFVRCDTRPPMQGLLLVVRIIAKCMTYRADAQSIRDEFQ